jgi:hypothetical protein
MGAAVTRHPYRDSAQPPNTILNNHQLQNDHIEQENVVHFVKGF